jgi:hypothetical protein
MAGKCPVTPTNATNAPTTSNAPTTLVHWPTTHGANMQGRVHHACARTINDSLLGDGAEGGSQRVTLAADTVELEG